MRAFLKKIIDFRGRASRSEFWWWVFFVCLAKLFLGLPLYIAAVALHGRVNLQGWAVLGWEIRYSPFISYALDIASLAVSMRRLHDINRSGWSLVVLVGACFLSELIFLAGALLGIDVANPVTYASFVISGSIALGSSVMALLWFCKRGTVGDNKYGTDPARV